MFMVMEWIQIIVVGIEGDGCLGYDGYVLGGYYRK